MATPIEQRGYKNPDALVSTDWVEQHLNDRNVRLIGVEAGGEAITRGRHAARFAGGSAGVLQGTRTYVLQDDDGNIELTHSISAGLDYAAVGPEHSWLRSLGRAEYAYVTDGEATLVTGGTMVGGKQTAPGQHRGTDITGGQTQKLKKGDVVTIPAGVPHWFKDVSPVISYLTIKVIK